MTIRSLRLRGRCAARSLTRVPSILLVEDDVTLRTTVATYCRAAGFEVVAVADGRAALSAYAAGGVDVVLLDLMLPGDLSGRDVCRRLRARDPRLPIIMVTARAQEHERIQGFHLGADDYVTKPFSLRELVLRVHALLRRIEGADAATAVGPDPLSPGGERATTARGTGDLVDGDLRLLRASRRLRRAGEDVSLTAREFDLLVHFLERPSEVFSRDELLRWVWGWEAGDASTVTVHVRRLREKVEVDPSRPRRLVTVFGRGYRWDPQDSDAQDPAPRDAHPQDPAPRDVDPKDPAPRDAPAPGGAG